MPRLDIDMSKISLNVLVTIGGFIGTWLTIWFGVLSDVRSSREQIHQQEKVIIALQVATEAAKIARVVDVSAAADMKARIETLTAIVLRIEQRQFNDRRIQGDQQ